MNVLFYTTYLFNTETFGPYLEMIQNHLNLGDKVTLISCNGELTSCQTNPNHSKLVCDTCISTRKNGLSCLNGSFSEKSLSTVLPENNFDPKLELINYSSIKELKEVSFETMDIGIAVLSSIVSVFRDPTPDLIKNKELIIKQWTSSMWVYEAFKKELSENKYDSVYVFNARFATLRACLRACEFVKVACFVLEEGRNKSTYTVYPGVLPHSLTYNHEAICDYWENATDDKVEIASDYYLKRSRSDDDRFGYFTADQEKGKLPENWDISKNNIAIFNSSEDEFVAIGKEWENRLYTNQVEAIDKITKDMEFDDSYRFYIRIHPNLLGIYNKSIIDLFNIKRKNVFIIPPDSKVSTYALMFHSNKIISFGSSVGIEAAAFDKISILAGQSFYKNLGSTFNPENHSELIDLLKTPNLEPKPKEGALKYAYFLVKFGVDYTHFKRIDAFQATMNGKLYRPALPFWYIRKIGRWMRLKKVAKQKERNIQKVHELQN